MNVRMALIEALPRIIAESVKPFENIEGIKILHVEGLGGATGAPGAPVGPAGIADQAVDAALRYRGQAPLVDALLGELGLKGGSLSSLVSEVVPAGQVPANTVAAGDSAAKRK